MPSVIEVLQGMIADKFRHRATGNYLILSEAGQQDYALGVGVPHFAMRIDLPSERGGLDVTFPFLRAAVAGLTCKCDLIVFVPREEKVLVFLVELKTLNRGQYLTQLRSAREFAEYLIGLMNVHNLGNFAPEYRGVLIISRRIPAKGTTRQLNVSFERRNGLDVFESDRSRPLSLSDLVKAVE